MIIDFHFQTQLFAMKLINLETFDFLLGISKVNKMLFRLNHFIIMTVKENYKINEYSCISKFGLKTRRITQNNVHRESSTALNPLT